MGQPGFTEPSGPGKCPWGLVSARDRGDGHYGRMKSKKRKKKAPPWWAGLWFRLALSRSHKPPRLGLIMLIPIMTEIIMLTTLFMLNLNMLSASQVPLAVVKPKNTFFLSGHWRSPGIAP